MSNPVEDFLKTKEAFGPPGGVMNRFGRKVVEGGGLGLAFAGMSAGVAGIAAAANGLYNAATKKHDFDKMLEANPHLMPTYEREPENFSRVFSSIRAMNPEFSKDPLVAGAFMFEAMESAPEQRGFVPVRAHKETGKKTLGPASDAAMSGFRSGIGMKLEGAQGMAHAQSHDHSDMESIPAY